MEPCKGCIYLVTAGDPKEPINECHRMPPLAMGKDMAVYPLVKDGNPGCGERATAVVAAAEKAVEKAAARAVSSRGSAAVNLARAKRLK